MMIVTFIISLYQRQCPNTVVGAIISVIANTFNLVLGSGSATHILEKHGKIVPFGANSNPPTAVVGVGLAARVITAFTHRFPYRILRKMGQPVCAVSQPRSLSIPTSAAFNTSVAQQLGANARQLTALAPTEPYVHAKTRYTLDNTQYRQVVKGLPCQVYKIMDGWFGKECNGRIVGGHIGSFLTDLIRPIVVTDFRAISI